MVLSLLFNRKYAQSNVGGVFLDATLTEDHNYSSVVTNYPVESGRNISDHIYNEPITVQITGIVTDSPLSFLSSFNRSIDAFNRLILIHQRRERITVVTGIKVYPSMVMTNLQVPRNVNTGQSLTFSIQLQQMFTDNSVRTYLDPNDPFNRVQDKIPREIVADANKYPYYGADPTTSLKDQASSAVDIGIQDLQPIPNKILPNVLNGLNQFRGLV